MFHILALILALMPLQVTPDKEQQDSLVRLMNAQSAQMLKDIDGTSYRKVIGPASFLHNNTYLICDTAIWNVDTKIINAFGNVQILQNETVLTSQKLDYYIDDNLAQFRGTLVQLQDKEGNTLRTRFLDYNTKDSVAIFERGASFRDKDGQLIESRDGSYDSKIKTFRFEHNVNMFTDSVFVKSPELEYISPEEKAYFYSGVDAWKEDNMLSAKDGYYSSRDSLFFFRNMVHAQTKDQEAWSDTLFIYRASKNVMMLGNAQIKDTTRNFEALAHYIFYEDSTSSVTLMRDAAVAAVTKEKDQLDTIYVGADKVVYRTIKKCDINAGEIATAVGRIKDLGVDAVSEYRSKAAAKAESEVDKDEKKETAVKPVAKDSVAVELNPIEKRRAQLAEKQARKDAKAAARQAAKEKRKALSSAPVDSLSIADTLSVPITEAISPDDVLSSESPAEDIAPEIPAEETAVTQQDDTSALNSNDVTSPDSPAAISDSLAAGTDSLAAGTDSLAAGADSLAAGADSLTAGADSLALPPDTTKIGFLFANGKVKAFKKNMQMRCDSLIYSDLDSLARLYINPIIWNDGNRQYTSDSVSVLIKDSKLSRANLSSNAFIIVQEDTAFFDQIHGSEILAYFNEDGGLGRFDALGNASAVFYIEENGALATVNKVESKMLSAILDSNKVQRVFYFDNPKNNAFPTMQLPREDKRMKGFNWDPDSRPKSPEDITVISMRKSERKSYNDRPKANFRYTQDYFPGYIDEIYRQIEMRDSIERARLLHADDSLPPAASDSLDLTAPADTLSKTPADSLNSAPADSLKAAATDSLSTAPADSISTPAADGLKESPADSLSKAPVDSPDSSGVIIPRDKWEERALKRMEKAKQREARWAELDARDEQKAAERAAKKLEQQRAKTRRLLEIQEKQAAKNQKRLDRYVKKLEKKKAKRPLPQIEPEGLE